MKELGLILITKWSCDFNLELVQNEDLKNFVENLSIVEPINLWDCYFGGRTNALTLHKKFENGEKGHYVDFCSLYPDILKYQKFPVGHPEKILKDFSPVNYVVCDKTCSYSSCTGYHANFPYFGIVKAKFLPPKRLLHPVLPVKCNNKLKFPLCYNCAVNDNKECQCDDEKRSFVHIYCTSEVDVALNVGYKIVEIFEVLHWKEYDLYDMYDEQGGIFTNYINTFLKIKQEASDLPENISPENVHEYIESYQRNEGISLRENNIK